MKFLIDAQLPPSLTRLITEQGHDAIHTISLHEKNFTPDAEINRISLKDQRIVVPKDSDFYHSFLIKREPYKVLLISVGNMDTGTLKELVAKNLPVIERYFREGHLVDITKKHVKLLV